MVSGSVWAASASKGRLTVLGRDQPPGGDSFFSGAKVAQPLFGSGSSDGLPCSLRDHEDAIRDFLSDVDPNTGYID